MITIKKIAEMAGVAPTTVSNVLHGRTAKMSKETLAKVQAVIKETQYGAGEENKGFLQDGSKLIGVIITYGMRDIKNPVQDPFYGEMTGALEQEIRRKGYAMMLFASKSAEETLQIAAAFRMAGLIVLNCRREDCSLILKKIRVPVVFTDSYCPKGLKGGHSIGLRDFEGALLMTEFLQRKGHEKIAFLAEGEKLEGVDAQRFAGYRTAMEAAGLPFEKHIPLSAADAVRRFKLEQFCRTRLKQFTALFFASDYYAVDAVNLFFSLGIRVPDEISVAGFDDNLLAKLCRPGLTSVHQDPAQKAKHAVRLLFSCIKGQDAEEEVLLPVSVTERASVRNLR